MARQLSVAVRNARGDAYETAIGTAPKLRLYTGAQPATSAVTPMIFSRPALPTIVALAASLALRSSVL